MDRVLKLQQANIIMKAHYSKKKPQPPSYTGFCVKLVVQIVGLCVAIPCRLLVGTSICEQSVVPIFTAVLNVKKQ